MEQLIRERYWALEENYFSRMHSLVMHRIQSHKDISNLITPIAHPKAGAIEANHLITLDEESDLIVYQMEDGRKSARIPLVGVLSKYGGLCSYGAKDIEQMIAAANASKSIESITLIVDGPGGSVSGTASLGMAIRDSQKPVVAFVDEMAASAHYWVTSQADYIVGNAREYTQVGSIGVLAVLLNESEYLKKEGKEVRIMRADQSIDKARLNSVEPWPEAELQKLQQELNEIAEDFISTVKAGRGLRLQTARENMFTGKMYELPEALDLGMIDSAGELSDAIQLAADVASTRKKSSIQKSIS
jgi:protease-4